MFSLFSVFSLNSQTTFSKIHSNTGTTLFHEHKDLEIVNNVIYTYYQQFLDQDSIQIHSAGLQNYDFSGNILANHEIDTIFPNNDHRFIVENGHIYINGSRHNSGFLGRDIHILKFDTDLNHISTFQRGSAPEDITNTQGMISDGEYAYLYETVFEDADTAFARITKLDLDNQEVIWDRRYKENSWRNQCYGLAFTHEGNVAFINPWDNGAGNGLSGRMIYEVDTNGDPVDAFEIGRDSHYERLYYSSDDHFYTATDYRLWEPYIEHTGFFNKFDASTNELVWSIQLPRNRFTDQRFYSVHDIIEASNGDIVICGNVNDFHNDDYGYSGFIARISTDGEIIWNRVYKIPNPLPIEEQERPFRYSYLNRIEEAPNGGFVAVGTVRFFSPFIIPEDWEFQEFWLLSVDENGNLEGEEKEEIIVIDGKNANTPNYQIGTTWTYEAQTFLSPGQLYPVTITLTDTTRINDTLAFVVESSAPNNGFLSHARYMHVDDGKVYFYHDDFEHFVLNYDYNEPESYEVPWVDLAFGGGGIAEVIRDSIGPTDLPNGDTIRTQFVSLVNNGSTTGPMPERIFDGIGADGYFRLKLGFGGVDSDQITRLRCFHPNGLDGDSTINFVGFPCDSTFIPTSTQEFAPAELLTVYPNPTSGQIQIDGLSPTDAAPYELRDLAGRLLRSGRLLEPRLELGDLPFGTYLLRIETREGSYVERVSLLR
ncbi:hypothetical protein CEQ90_13465 [Lewinellaceae bacterium SD302]|nr:hypothetical protein CEQ90_13465 [Lewinellaceae bacterium SD302]